jgi:hypothetical protein
VGKLGWGKGRRSRGGCASVGYRVGPRQGLVARLCMSPVYYTGWERCWGMPYDVQKRKQYIRGISIYGDNRHSQMQKRNQYFWNDLVFMVERMCQERRAYCESTTAQRGRHRRTPGLADPIWYVSHCSAVFRGPRARFSDAIVLHRSQLPPKGLAHRLVDRSQLVPGLVVALCAYPLAYAPRTVVCNML